MKFQPVLDDIAAEIRPLLDTAGIGNGGGTVTLLDAGGLKVHGVAYTAADAEHEGWTVAF